jgi:hypothetical protein
VLCFYAVTVLENIVTALAECRRIVMSGDKEIL